MDANALRALADALSSGTHYVESPELHEAMMRAADYLRACADAQPAPAVPQAEPKREPTCLWSRADDDADLWETECGHAFTLTDGTPTENEMLFCNFCGKRVEDASINGIGGSDAE